MEKTYSIPILGMYKPHYVLLKTPKTNRTVTWIVGGVW